MRLPLSPFTPISIGLIMLGVQYFFPLGELVPKIGYALLAIGGVMYLLTKIRE